jgi:hypothetical protein
MPHPIFLHDIHLNWRAQMKDVAAVPQLTLYL